MSGNKDRNSEERDLVEVSVKVPSSRLADFYSFLGRWMSGELVDDGPPERVSLQPWGTTHHDKKLALQVLNRLTPQAKRMFETLASHPEERFDGNRLAEVAEIPNGRYGIAGALAWPSKKFAQFHRPLPLEIEPREGGSLYWVDAGLAELVLDGLRGRVPEHPSR